MPRIAEYTAPISTLNPSERGSAAWGQAGHRISSLYGAAASNAREAGALAAAVEKQKIWPFDILELYARKAAQIEAAAQAEARTTPAAKAAAAETGGGGVRAGRTSGGFPVARASYGPGYGSSGTGEANEARQIARGAGALGDALSDGGYGAARRTTADAEGGVAYTLEKGELVRVSDARKAMNQYNADRDKYIQDETNKLVDTQNYWIRYNGGDTTQTDQRFSTNSGPNTTDFGGSVDRTIQDAWRPETSWTQDLAGFVGSAVSSTANVIRDAGFGFTIPAVSADISLVDQSQRSVGVVE